MTQKFTLLILVAALCIPFIPFAQTQPEKPFIEVNGYAEKEIIPDEIYIGINIIEKMENRVKVTIQEQEEKLKTALKAININLDDFALSDASSDYVRVRWNTKDVITRKSYTLKVGSALQVGQVYLELEKLDIKEARIERVNHSQLENLKKELRIEAIDNAKKKADYLLETINEKRGNALVVNESFDRFPENYLLATEVNMVMDKKYERQIQSFQKESGEIQFQKVKLRSNIYVKFAIKQ